MDLFASHMTPNRWLTEEQRVPGLFPRLERLTSADGFVVLQGSIGTLTEATLTWSLLQTGQIAPKPFIFVGAGWRPLFDAFRAETLMSEADFSLARIVDIVDEAVDLLRESETPTP
jgi:predicted Rossmann-fold nucleotide-binding protein